ncbi:MAG TPA: hypothetical protein VG412_02225, partial [Acidimicrobiales bacterium]|nr:hypothetical protein [Acidimicrobiales bacterium]
MSWTIATRLKMVAHGSSVQPPGSDALMHPNPEFLPACSSSPSLQDATTTIKDGGRPVGAPAAPGAADLWAATGQGGPNSGGIASRRSEFHLDWFFHFPGLEDVFHGAAKARPITEPPN